MISNFIEENFFYLHPGYNTFNTIVFGIVLGVIILGINELFKRIDKNPNELMFVLIPLIVFGSTSRALVDNQIYPRIHLLATPGIYIFIGIMTIILLLLSTFLERHLKYKYTDIILVFGSIICIPNIALMIIHGINFNILLIEITCFLIVSSPFIIFRKNVKILNNHTNLKVLLAHILDATSTFIALDFFNYSEQHVLPTFMINLAGTALIMYPLKIIIILSILCIIDRLLDDKIDNNTLKLSIYILGLAPAVRNISTLILSII